MEKSEGSRRILLKGVAAAGWRLNDILSPEDEEYKLF